MKKLYRISSILMLILLCLSFFSSPAQDRKRPSDKRSQEKNNKSADKVFGDDDPAFAVTNIPEKWSKESAVLIHQRLEYTYLRSNTGIEFTEMVRKRVKLLDQAAIKEFSEFYFVATDNVSTGIQVIKSDGTVSKVDLGSAVEVKTQIPDFYRVLYYKGGLTIGYKKIAIPNLTEGDIIDYFYKNERSTIDAALDYAGGTLPFEAFRFTMSGTYPILSQELRFTVDRGFFVNFASYLGAPELTKEEGTKKEIKGRSRGTISTYVLVDKDREKLPDDLWTYKYKENPYVKFQVFYSSPRLAEMSQYFLGTMDSPQNSVTTDELIKTLNRMLKDPNQFAKDKVLGDMRKYNKELNNKKKIVNYAYYYFRKVFLDEVISGDNISRTPDYSIGDYIFVKTMIAILDDKDIEAEVVVTSPKWRGEVKDILLHDDILVGLYIKELKMFIFPFTALSTPQTIPVGVQGTKAITFKLNRNERNLTSSTITIPNSQADDNVSKEISKVTVSDNLEELTIKRKNQETGAMADEPYVFTASGTNLLDEDESVLYKKAKPKRVSRSDRLQKQKTKAKINEAEEEALDRIKENLKKSFDVVSYDDIELENSGRYDDNPTLEYDESLKIKGLINKAGRNYMFEIGKLIGKQVEVSQENRERKGNIYLDEPCTLIDEITVELPMGYKAEGLEELAIDVDNPAMTFKSTLRQEGTSIVVSTKLSYKKAYDDKANWGDWLKGLDAAQKFYQGKIVLKKI